MNTVVTELVVRADGALSTLKQVEQGMRGVGRASEFSSGAVSQFEAVSAKFIDAQRRGIAITAQKVESVSREQRAYETLGSKVDKVTALEIKLRREAARSAVAAANAVALGYATQEDAVSKLIALERQHAQQMAAVRDASQRAVAANDNFASSARRMAAANDNASFATANLAAQFQDVAVTAAMGMNPLQIALQQGTQISAVFGGMGAAGAVRALGAAFLSVINPISLLTIAFVAAGAAAIQYFMSTDDEAKDMETVLKRHDEAIRALKDAYGEAASGAKAYLGHTTEMARAMTIIAQHDLAKAYAQNMQELVDSGELVTRSTSAIAAEIDVLKAKLSETVEMDAYLAIEKQIEALHKQLNDVSAGALTASERFRPFKTEIDAFIESVRRGEPDIIALKQAVSERIAVEPNNAALSALGGALLDLIEAGFQTQSALEASRQSITSLGSAALANAGAVSGLADALQTLREAAPEAAAAFRVTSDLVKANAARGQAMAILNRNVELGILSEDSYLRKLEEVETMHKQAIDSVSGYGDAVERVARSERENAIATMTDRKAAAARITDTYQEQEKAIIALRDAGRDQAEVDALLARNTKAMSDALAVSTRHFDEMEAKAGARGAAKSIREAAKAARDAERDFQSFARQADGLVDRLFPAEGARREALELMGLLDQYGSRLDEVQRKAVEMEVSNLFRASELGLRRLSDKSQDAFEKMAETVESTLGDALADLFSKPMDDMDDFFRDLMRNFAQVGQQNISGMFDGMLSGRRGSSDPSSPDFQANTTLGELVGAVEKGTGQGIGKAFQWLIGGGSGSPGTNPGGTGGFIAGPAGAAIGGVGIGYQTQSPVMGALGGALSGFAATGNPLGAIIGGIAGLIGGILGKDSGKNRKRWDAMEEVHKNYGSISEFISLGMGTGASGLAKTMRDWRDSYSTYLEMAEKAKDTGLQDRLKAANENFYVKIRRDFEEGFAGTIEGLELGLGLDSPFAKAKDQMIALREPMLAFVSDAEELYLELERQGKMTHAETWENIHRASTAARDAMQAYAVSIIAGAEPLSAMEEQMMSLKGTASAMQQTLELLGMSADEAATAIENSLAVAVDKLRDEYRRDVQASIDSLLDRDYLNEIAEAQEIYNNRLKDAAALGISSETALMEFNLTLGQIARNAGLTDEQLQIISDRFPELASSMVQVFDMEKALGSAQSRVEQARASLSAAYQEEASAIESTIGNLRRLIDTLGSFRDTLKTDATLSTLSSEDRFLEARRQYEEVAALALSGDEDALGRLQGLTQQYLDEAKAYYGSSEEYFQIFESVDGTLEKALDAASRQISVAERQLQRLERQVELLIDINTGVTTVAEAIFELNAAIAALAEIQKQRATPSGSAGSSPSDYVASLYRTVLNREADATGAAYWENRLAVPGTTREELRRLFTISAQPELERGYPVFQRGGYTGDLATSAVAGVVHGQEFVAHAEATRRWRPQLEAMNKGTYSGSDNSAMVAEIRALREENREIRDALEGLAMVIGESGERTREAIKEGNRIQKRAADTAGRAA